MAECIIRKATRNDADQLYDLIIESTGVKIGLTRARFRNDLAGVYELAEKDIDKQPFMPNCPVCQAYLAFSGEQLIGYVLFHYHYSPWSGRSAFIDDIYVRLGYRGRGIAKNLLRMLSEFSRSQNLAALYFNTTNMSQELKDKAKSYQAKVVRNSQTDWSVYRIEFKG